MPHMRALLFYVLSAAPRPARAIVSGQKMSRPPLKARPHAPTCRVSPPHLVMHGFFVAAALALVMGEC
jgi:hypothetical protein